MKVDQHEILMTKSCFTLSFFILVMHIYSKVDTTLSNLLSFLSFAEKCNVQFRLLNTDYTFLVVDFNEEMLFICNIRIIFKFSTVLMN